MKNVVFICLLSIPLFCLAAEESNADYRAVKVAVDIDKSLLPSDAENWILYVYASKPGARLPLANFKGKLSQLPLNVTLNESMYLLPHLTLKQAEDIVIIAKTTKSDNPHQKSSEDLIGYSNGLSFKDNAKLSTSVTIDQRDKNKPAK
ncbi:hypothetical protein HII17_13110 [Thalassotalea sp. M1531]|uniref:Cytochrome c-type biogenesis protein H Ig-like domain-containing protein n=1 Tax=Thalassotalea algicola TaxID=2716224 RepID=A0A7Y0LE54_9GAMM|nr:hypothetical protein [Thalassotalea algicola]NMP32502.1 hypothetical protein [Thalassotalea algicola]